MQVENWCPRLPWRTKTLGEDTDRRGQVRKGSPCWPLASLHDLTTPGSAMLIEQPRAHKLLATHSRALSQEALLCRGGKHFLCFFLFPFFLFRSYHNSKDARYFVSVCVCVKIRAVEVNALTQTPLKGTNFFNAQLMPGSQQRQKWHKNGTRAADLKLRARLQRLQRRRG